MARFAYDPEIIARYPTIVGGVLHVPAVVNGPSSPELLAASQAEQSATLQRIGDTPLSEIPSLQAQPDVEVELKDGIRRVRGHAATGDERERLLELWRQFGDYDAYAVRRPTETAIVVLETRA